MLLDLHAGVVAHGNPAVLVSSSLPTSQGMHPIKDISRGEYLLAELGFFLLDMLVKATSFEDGVSS